MLSEISQRKINFIRTHLYMESNKSKNPKNGQVTDTENKFGGSLRQDKG